MNTLVSIEELLKHAENFPVIDVRSPAEFQQGHIPDAYNVPLFDNEERAKVGIAYKQAGRQGAIEIGLELAGPKLSSFITQVKKIKAPSISPQGGGMGMQSPSLGDGLGVGLPTVLVHCWRGGMRSEYFARLLNLAGIKTYTLLKGYKAYRNFVLSSFEHSAVQIANRCYILGGETGSGKTEVLKKISEMGEPVINLEELAHHKGSAFGTLGEKPQPTQEQFENNLAVNFSKVLNPGKVVWIEDEARSIGKMVIPLPLWEIMKSAPLIKIHIPKMFRVQKLISEYGSFSKEELAGCILKIQERLGGQNAKEALQALEKNNLLKAAEILLAYYDKAYRYDLEKRTQENIFLIECETTDASLNAEKILKAHPFLPPKESAGGPPPTCRRRVPRVADRREGESHRK